MFEFHNGIAQTLCEPVNGQPKDSLLAPAFFSPAQELCKKSVSEQQEFYCAALTQEVTVCDTMRCWNNEEKRCCSSIREEFSFLCDDIDEQAREDHIRSLEENEKCFQKDCFEDDSFKEQSGTSHAWRLRGLSLMASLPFTLLVFL